MSGRLLIFFQFCCLLGQAQEVSFHKDVLPILQDHCIKCHQPGEIGPMPLTTYEEVSSYASMIAYVTKTHLMPPWYADTSYQHMYNENVLSSSEIDMISQWVNGGMLEGYHINEEKISKEEGEPNLPDWEIGMSEAFEQYGIYYDQWQVFVIPVPITEDIYVTDMEFVPGNRDIVKNCTVSLSLSDTSDSLDQWNPRYGYFQFGGIGFQPEEYVFYHWSAGDKRLKWQDGIGKVIPKGSKLLFHINYGPIGEPTLDSSLLRIWTNDKISHQLKSRTLITSSHLLNPPFLIAPDEVKTFHAVNVIDRKIAIHSIMPMGQLICRSWEIYAKSESGVITRLLKIPEWNIHWKRNYQLSEPIILEPGTAIHAIAKYNNTEENVSNPAYPTTVIQEGYGMFEELFQVHFEIVEY